MVGIGGDEHEQRRLDLHQALHHREAVEPGHLDVEEDQVGLVRLDCADRLAAILALLDDLDIVEGLQAEFKPLDRQRLVIHQNRSNRHATSLVGSSSWNGISISTTNLPPGMDCVSKRWSGPYAWASRSLILVRPSAVERDGRGFISCRPGPVSDTAVCALSPASRATTAISAPSSSGVTAYLIAFSTSGWSSKEV